MSLPPAQRGTHEQAYGRSRGEIGCKAHYLSDARGIPLAFHLTGGEAHDATAFDTLRTLAEDRNADLIADKGYDSDAIGQALIQDGLRPVIPPRSNDMSAVRWNKRVYR